MTAKALTCRQREVLDFVEDFRRLNQKPPTRQEISRHFGWASANAAEEHLQAIARKGHIRITKGEARGVYVIADPLPSDWPFMAKAA